MDQKKWIDKPVRERLQWYHKKLDKLIDDLENTMQGDTLYVSQDNREELQEIKKRMVYDGTPSGNRLSSDKIKKEDEKRYYKRVYNAYKTLPNLNSDQEDWINKLQNANKLLYAVKSED